MQQQRGAAYVHVCQSDVVQARPCTLGDSRWHRARRGRVQCWWRQRRRGPPKLHSSHSGACGTRRCRQARRPRNSRVHIASKCHTRRRLQCSESVQSTPGAPVQRKRQRWNSTPVPLLTALKRIVDMDIIAIDSIITVVKSGSTHPNQWRQLAAVDGARGPFPKVAITDNDDGAGIRHELVQQPMQEKVQTAINQHKRVAPLVNRLSHRNASPTLRTRSPWYLRCKMHCS